MYRGEWVLDDTFFLVQWNWIDDGDIRYIPMFDPAQRRIYDVRKIAGISPDLTCPETDVSRNGKYLWILCWGTDYLVDLSNFETTIYPKSSSDYSQAYIDWSEDSQFAWIQMYDSVTNSTVFQMFCIADKKFCPLPVTPLSQSEHWWHPTDNIVVYSDKDKNALIFLDISTMTYRELLFNDQASQYKISNLAWNPNGDKLIFITEDHILWQVDHPSLANLEQILASTNTIGGAQWSPDIKSISFINGSDIYIIDITK